MSKQKITAMILAAGLGSRLGELTAKRPKALIDVNNKAIIEYVIENIIACGINEIVINVHYLADQLVDYILSKNYSAKFHFSREEKLLDTGGAILNAQDYFKDRDHVLIHNCDIYTEFQLANLIDDHLSDSERMITLAVSQQKSPRYLWFNEDRNLIGYENEQSGFRYLIENHDPAYKYDYNCINIIDTKVLKLLNKLPNKFSLFDGYLKAVEQGAAVKPHDIGDAYWIDIGTPQDLLKVKNYLLS